MSPGQVDVRVKILNIMVGQLLGSDKLGNCLPLLVHGVVMVHIKVKIIIRGKGRTVVAMISEIKFNLEKLDTFWY